MQFTFFEIRKEQIARSRGLRLDATSSGVAGMSDDELASRERADLVEGGRAHREFMLGRFDSTNHFERVLPPQVKCEPCEHPNGVPCVHCQIPDPQDRVSSKERPMLRSDGAEDPVDRARRENLERARNLWRIDAEAADEDEDELRGLDETSLEGLLATEEDEDRAKRIRARIRALRERRGRGERQASSSSSSRTQKRKRFFSEDGGDGDEKKDAALPAYAGEHPVDRARREAFARRNLDTRATPTRTSAGRAEHPVDKARRENLERMRRMHEGR